jgi:hypothetical protein
MIRDIILCSVGAAAFQGGILLTFGTMDHRWLILAAAGVLLASAAG